MKETKEILEQLFCLVVDFKDVEPLIYSDTLQCTYNVKYEYLCAYKSFFQKNTIVDMQTLFALFSEQKISETHLEEFKQLIDRVNLLLNDSTKQHEKYNSFINGGEIINRMLNYRYLNSIENIYKSIKHLKEENPTDPCTSEYENIYLQQKHADNFRDKNSWLYTFNPYKEFKAIFDYIINFIDSYMTKELTYFSLKDCSTIYELCNGEIFEKSQDIDFYKFLNLSGSKEIRIKSKMRDKTSFLIHLLTDYLISDKKENIEEWEAKILEKLKISKSTYDSKYKKMPSTKLSLEESIRVILEERNRN